MSYTLFVYGTLRPDLLLEQNPPRLAYTFHGCEYKQAWLEIEGKLITTPSLNYPFLVEDESVNTIPGNLITLPETSRYFNIFQSVNRMEVYAGYYLIPVVAYTLENEEVVSHCTYTYWSDIHLKNPVVMKDYKEYLYGKSST